MKTLMETTFENAAWNVKLSLLPNGRFGVTSGMRFKSFAEIEFAIMLYRKYESDAIGSLLV